MPAVGQTSDSTMPMIYCGPYQAYYLDSGGRIFGSNSRDVQVFYTDGSLVRLCVDDSVVFTISGDTTSACLCATRDDGTMIYFARV